MKHMMGRALMHTARFFSGFPTASTTDHTIVLFFSCICSECPESHELQTLRLYFRVENWTSVFSTHITLEARMQQRASALHPRRLRLTFQLCRGCFGSASTHMHDHGIAEVSNPRWPPGEAPRLGWPGRAARSPSKRTRTTHDDTCFTAH